MKKFLALIFVLATFAAVFTGCEKTDRSGKNDETTTLEAQTMEVESTYNKNSKTMKTVYYAADGSVASTVVTVYNDKKLVEKESTYDEEDKLVSTISYKYDKNSNIIEMAVYDGDNKLEYMNKDYEYKKVKTDKGEKFIKLKYNRYNSEAKVDTIFKWEYDEDYNCISMATYSPEGKLLTQNEF